LNLKSQYSNPKKISNHNIKIRNRLSGQSIRCRAYPHTKRPGHRRHRSSACRRRPAHRLFRYYPGGPYRRAQWLQQLLFLFNEGCDRQI